MLTFIFNTCLQRDKLKLPRLLWYGATQHGSLLFSHWWLHLCPIKHLRRRLFLSRDKTFPRMMQCPPARNFSSGCDDLVQIPSLNLVKLKFWTQDCFLPRWTGMDFYIWVGLCIFLYMHMCYIAADKHVCRGAEGDKGMKRYNVD